MVDPSLEGTFTDVSNHWAKDDILMATGMGLFRGMTDSTFCPQMPLSRGQLVTVLYRMEGSPEITGSSGFQDVAPISITPRPSPGPRKTAWSTV